MCLSSVIVSSVTLQRRRRTLDAMRLDAMMLISKLRAHVALRIEVQVTPCESAGFRPYGPIIIEEDMQVRGSCTDG